MKKSAPTRSSNQLRIIGGKWRGRKLQFPNIEGLRPTSDRIRETLFNWLTPALPNSRCLDLFAGSGALTFESLSRGAEHVVAIDTDSSVAQQLRSSGHKLLTSALQVKQADTCLWLKQAQLSEPDSTQQAFDIVFIDPPFQANLLAAVVELLTGSNLVAVGTLIYLEADKIQPLPQTPKWQRLRHKVAGQVQYALFEVLS